VEAIVEEDIKNNVFSKESIDDHFDRMYNKKSKQKGYNHKFNGIDDKHRNEFISHLNRYLIKLGDRKHLDRKRR